MCNKHVKIIEQMDKTAQNADLSNCEIALNHMALIGQERKTLNILGLNPCWADISTSNPPCFSPTTPLDDSFTPNHSNEPSNSLLNPRNKILGLDNLLDISRDQHIDKHLIAIMESKKNITKPSPPSRIHAAGMSFTSTESTFDNNIEKHNELLVRKRDEITIRLNPPKKRKINSGKYELSDSDDDSVINL